MGEVIDVYCKTCDFKEEELFIGGGRESFRHTINLPAFDLETKKFILANYRNRKELRGKVLFYAEDIPDEIIETKFQKWWNKLKAKFSSPKITPPQIEQPYLFNGKDALYLGKNNRGIQCWNTYVNCVNNKCPQCGNYTMNFKEIAMWD